VDLFRRTDSARAKNGAVDTLPLNDIAVDVLKAQARVWHLSSDYVFPTNSGTRKGAGNLGRAFTLACVRAKVERFRFHDLRHTFATRLVRAGVDLYAVQKLGGWKTISMVMRYAHHYSESLRPGVEALVRVRSSTELAQGVEMGSVAHA